MYPDFYWSPPLRHQPNHYPVGGWYTRTVTKTTTTTPVDEEAIRKIVREEIADLIPVDVPDAPPENL